MCWTTPQDYVKLNGELEQLNFWVYFCRTFDFPLLTGYYFMLVFQKDLPLGMEGQIGGFM